MPRFVHCFLVFVGLFVVALPPVQAQDKACFSQTGQCIEGRFRTYWEQNGSLPVFGYPISAARDEVNPDTGKTYLTQWFERNRFELHPENAAPYDVLLGRLGDDRLNQQSRDWQAFPKASSSSPHYFPQTGHAIGPQFWDYWRSRGLDFGDPGISQRESLALFGLPISEPAMETNASGATVLTQWFERARVEFHPSNPPAFTVLLGLLGNEVRLHAGGALPVMVGAGDIASCDSSGDEATAALLDQIAGTVFTTGDNVYEAGTTTEFADCYGPSWGRHKARTRPAAGNSEYDTPGATGYFHYFGAAAGDPTQGYYSYDLGAWHVVVLNSNCAQVGGCQADSPQERWLRADLQAHLTTCTVAYWHHPRFNSGPGGNSATLQPIWQALYEGGVDVVLNGHDHAYERFAPQTPDGTADAARGIRQFVVGTGGRSHSTLGALQPNSEVRNNDTFGVLKLTLHARSYDWQFIPEAGRTFKDAGSAACH